MVNYLAKPWLLLPSQTAHHIGMRAIKLYSGLCSRSTPEWQSFKWKNLEFKNPLGISGGVDKDSEFITDWWKLGAGFIEAGTVTPRPQPGNSGKVIDRINSKKAVWNRMGFPSKGLEFTFQQLENLKRPYETPVFANVGKNADTSLENAHHDYIQCIEKLEPVVDGFVVNISSPNTAGLRELLKPERLKSFLSPILTSAKKASQKPLLLKLSPDMDEASLRSALDTSYDLGVDGWILTNTSVTIREGLDFPIEGGVSGAPLTLRSRECLKIALEHLGSRREGKLVVSSGGIMSGEEARLRLSMGANLVQVYSALIFEGPGFFRKCATKGNLQAAAPAEVTTWR